MATAKLLRRQVDSELKKRRYILFTLLILSVLYVATTLLLGDRGIMRYVELMEKESSLSVEVDDVRDDNERLKGVIQEYSDNDYYIEKNARDKFGLSGEDEFLYIYEK